MPDQCTEIANGDKILLSSAEAKQIARLLRMLMPGGNSLSTMIKNVERIKQFQPSTTYDADKLRTIARQIYIRRQARMRYFPEDYFREPAWDMLLALYAGSDDEIRQMVSSLVTFTSVPQTTALRYLSALEHNGHVLRHDCAQDGRVNLIGLTEAAHDSMNQYLAAMLESGSL